MSDFSLAGFAPHALEALDDYLDGSWPRESYAADGMGPVAAAGPRTGDPDLDDLSTGGVQPDKAETLSAASGADSLRADAAASLRWLREAKSEAARLDAIKPEPRVRRAGAGRPSN